MRNTNLYYVTPPSVWAVTIYVLSLIPLQGVPGVSTFDFVGADKIIHAVLYAVLSLLVLRGWQREKAPPWDLHLLVFGLCLVFGVMIEIHQALTPYRAFELADIAADATGIVLGQAAWHAMMIRWGKRTRLYPGLLRPDFKNHPSNRKHP